MEEFDRVREAMLAVDGVTAVHDLHVWSITSGMVTLSAHAVVPDPQRGDGVLAVVRERLHEQFGIDHVTVRSTPSRRSGSRSCAARRRCSMATTPSAVW